MRILILFFIMLLSMNIALAKNPFKKSVPPVLTTPGQSQIPIDDEFMQDFVGYDEKEAKAYEKEQKALLKLQKKLKKLEEKKVKLEHKKAKRLENYEKSKLYLERLKTTEEVVEVEENL